jgi:hypothetical protein
VFIFYTDNYKVPRPIEHQEKDDYEMYMYTTNPDLEENIKDRKRKEIYWGLHPAEIRHRFNYNLKLAVSH